MSSPECRQIEDQLNSILRGLATSSSDAQSDISAFPLTETYEQEFPSIDSSPHKYERKYSSPLSPPISNRSFNTVQESSKARTYKKCFKRIDGKFHNREENDCHEQNIRKRTDHIRSKPQKTHKNFDIRKRVVERKINDDNLEFDGSDLPSNNTLRNKLKDKEIHVLTADDVDLETNISTEPYKKLRNFKHANKEKKKLTDCPKGIDAKKIQANIFINAITEASSVGEAVPKRDKTKKFNEDKVYETQETSHNYEGDLHIASQNTITDIQLHADNEENRAATSSEKKTVWNTTDKYPSAEASCVQQPSKPEADAVKTDDEFIRRCNKQSCSCSKDGLYCTLCDFHIDNQRELDRHRKQASHEFRRKDYYRVKVLEAFDPPSRDNLIAIEELLQKIYVSHVLGAESNKQHFDLIEQLTDDLSSEVEKDCSFHLFGSSVSGFGHKDSNINIDLEVPQGISPSKMLLKTFDALKERENKYGNITKDFYVTFPSISFIDHKTKLLCEITLNNNISRQTNTLLKRYAEFDDRARKLGVVFRIWAQICGIDQQDFCSLAPHCFPLMVIHFLQQTEPPVLPVLHEMVGEVDVLNFEKILQWKTRNKQTLAELWIDLLKFYAIVFKYKVNVITIRQKEPLLCKDKKWTTRMICIEDPYHTKRNVARSIANPQWFQYIVECIRSSYEYFCTHRLPVALDDLTDVAICSNDDEESNHSFEENSIDIYFEDQDKDLEREAVISSLKTMDLGNKTQAASHKSDKRTTKPEYKSNFDKTLEYMFNPQSSYDIEVLTYRFEKSHLTNAKPPALYCRQCQKPNHVKKNCSIDDNLPELKKLPKMDKDHKEMLTEVCEAVFDFCRQTQENIQQNKFMLFDLQKHIQYVFKDAQLELFGSSCNGFGFGDSDLDICLTFYNKNAEDFDQKNIIEQLTRELITFRKIRNILPIPTAKVPIIKFSFGRKEGDISLYNTLGQHNTRLLYTYCKIDYRVQVLGYALKYFAKICDICDASRGSLSSYAYILMAIFYLQQLEVPVIPVLQQLYDRNKKMPVRLVDNWNTWFFEDISQLPSVWTDFGRNKQSLGELWMGLLIFYTEKFKMNEYVISIRQKEPLTRFEKLWNTRSIAIEDPFDHSHNLGAGISGKMNSFILAAFIRGRELFGKIPPARRDIGDLMEYFFNSKILTGGEKPPNERGCRKCSKIGHKAKECPLSKDNYFKGFRRRNTFDRKNNNPEQQKPGNFNKRTHYQDRNRGERQGMCNMRGTFRAQWNFRNSCDQDESRKTVAGYNANTQDS